MKNNKGFTLIEILGTVTILGILVTIGVTSTLKYLNSSRNKSYNMMSQSIYEATENCMIDNKCKVNTTISTDKLIEMGYIKELKNPISSRQNCTGKVYIKDDTSLISDYSFKKYKYEVTLNCDGLNIDNTTITWPDTKKYSY